MSYKINRKSDNLKIKESKEEISNYYNNTTIKDSNSNNSIKEEKELFNPAIDIKSSMKVKEDIVNNNTEIIEKTLESKNKNITEKD